MTGPLLLSRMSAVPLPAPTIWSDAARALAARLVTLAEPDAEGAPCWQGDALVPGSAGGDAPVLRSGVLDDGLLTGRAGIAVTLAVCSRLPGAEARWAPLARRAASAAVRTSAAGRPAGGLGWESGAFGVARAGAAVATVTGDPVLRTASERLGAQALDELAAGPGVLPGGPGLVGGVAGVVLGLVAAPLPAALDERRREAIPGLVDRLARLSREDAAGIRWPVGAVGTPAVGLADGASGIALALRLGARELAGHRRRSRTTPSAAPSPEMTFAASRARQLAAGALRWEADRGAGASGWCHGAPGIGLAAARLAALEPGTRVAREAQERYRGVAATIGAVVPGEPFDGTLCHGLAGVVAMHLAAAEAWPGAASGHLAAARAVASHLVRGGAPGRPTWTFGVPGGRTPNVLSGIAGVALVLAACHDPAVVADLGLVAVTG